MYFLFYCMSRRRRDTTTDHTLYNSEYCYNVELLNTQCNKKKTTHVHIWQLKPEMFMGWSGVAIISWRKKENWQESFRSMFLIPEVLTLNKQTSVWCSFITSTGYFTHCSQRKLALGKSTGLLFRLSTDSTLVGDADIRFWHERRMCGIKNKKKMIFPSTAGFPRWIKTCSIYRF